MSTDWRALAAELAVELERCRPLAEVPDCLARARAALDQPEPEVGPSDVELLELMPGQFREDLSTVSRMAAHGAGTGVTPGLFRVSLNTGALDFARAVIARYGNQPAPPAEGEVAELVEFLRIYGDHVLDEYGDVGEHDQLIRAAALLEQRHPAPVPISERLPGDELCWWFEADEDCGYGSNWTLLRIRGSATGYTHWLPATALPLPQGEVE